jgi:hypothetical protein
METMQEYLTLTKGACYLIAAVVLIGFIPFWMFLTEREKK